MTEFVEIPVCDPGAPLHKTLACLCRLQELGIFVSDAVGIKIVCAGRDKYFKDRNMPIQMCVHMGMRNEFDRFLIDAAKIEFASTGVPPGGSLEPNAKTG